MNSPPTPLEPTPFKVFEPEPAERPPEKEEAERASPDGKDQEEPETDKTGRKAELDADDEDEGASKPEEQAGSPVTPTPGKDGIEPEEAQKPIVPTPFAPPEPESVETDDAEVAKESPEIETEEAAESEPAEGGEPGAGEIISLEQELEDAMERAEQNQSTDVADELMSETIGDMEDGNYRRAIPKLEKVIEMKPELYSAWESLGWCYYRLGREQKARDLWNRLRLMAPGKAISYNLLAKLAAANNKLDKAVEYYRKSLEIDPDQYNTRVDFARTLRWKGSLDRSIEMLRDALEEDEHRNDVVLELARALTDNWDYAEALPLW